MDSQGIADRLIRHLVDEKFDQAMESLNAELNAFALRVNIEVEDLRRFIRPYLRASFDKHFGD